MNGKCAIHINGEVYIVEPLSGELILKAYKVMRSCETRDQIDVADRFCDLVLKRIAREDYQCALVMGYRARQYALRLLGIRRRQHAIKL